MLKNVHRDRIWGRILFPQNMFWGRNYIVIGWMDGEWVDGLWIDGYMNGRMDGWRRDDRWMDG